eukprot:scaffold2557_cov55-Phaeocystis_antarctica.AAC.2
MVSKSYHSPHLSQDPTRVVSILGAGSLGRRRDRAPTALAPSSVQPDRIDDCKTARCSISFKNRSNGMHHLFLSNLVVRALSEARVGERAGAVRGDPLDLVVAVRAGDGALALQMPVRSHRCANGRARADAAAAEAKRGGEGGGVERGKRALPFAAARLLDLGLRHGCGADSPLPQ